MAQQINWAEINQKLPTSKEEKPQRIQLWNRMDVNGNGYLSLAEVDKGLRDVLVSDQLFDAKPAIMRAFQHAKDYSPSKNKGGYGDDYIEKKEFRVFLIALRQRFEYF